MNFRAMIKPMTKTQIIRITNITKIFGREDLYFPVAMWLVSRIMIWVAMLLIAPNLVNNQEFTHFGWGIFDAWDSVHYRAIATSGYSFVNDGKQHNLAFFPLFPVSIWFLMKLGFSFEIAGILINNLAFLGTLYCLYLWLKKHCGIISAKWATAVISLCPMSMFTGVIYTEGL
jgi:Gpi18-like mannosyltransferase